MARFRLLRLLTWPWLLAGLVCLSGAAASQAAQAVEDPESVLVLGRISDDPRSHYEQLKPLLDYVVPRMAGVGIRSGRILMARDLRQMAAYLRRGQIDWVTETAGNAASLERIAGAHLLLGTERDGATHYRSLVFVRADSPVRSLQDLRGRSIAFQNPFSTTAYYLPTILLLDAGLPVEPLLTPMDKPSPGMVGYVFARTEANIGAWVHKRLVDAGAMSNLDWQNPQRMPTAYARDLRIIAESRPVPRALILTRGSMPPRVEARLREVLLEAAQDPEAGEALRRFINTSRFVPLDAADREAIRALAQGVQRIRLEVE